MGFVRPFRETDIPQVADLHRSVFNLATAPGPRLHRAYRNYFQGIFLNHPCSTPGICSLVYDESGTVTGFLGVTAQPIFIRDQPAIAAIGSQFIVDPTRRSSMAGLQLLKSFLSGPQSISIADEGSDLSRKLWTRLGGGPGYLQSISWARILRPARFLISRVSRRLPLLKAAAAATPLLHVADAVLSAIPAMRFSTVSVAGTVEHASPQILAKCLADLSSSSSVRPAYDSSHYLAWVLSVLERHTHRGRLRTCIVRSQGNYCVGSFIYYAQRGGLSEVLQLGAKPAHYEQVLQHLFNDAWSQGVPALCGRMEPAFMGELRKQNCLFHHRGYWMLVHSKNPEALQAIRCGDAFLTRLEGEYYCHFDEKVFASPLLIPQQQQLRNSMASA
ncbi:MAG: hypothetical protein HYX72_12150 [Acidobacteria bacterium]|nr:hypothetical protein [Acidobacteriota bacterium]